MVTLKSNSKPLIRNHRTAEHLIPHDMPLDSGLASPSVRLTPNFLAERATLAAATANLHSFIIQAINPSLPFLCGASLSIHREIRFIPLTLLLRTTLLAAPSLLDVLLEDLLRAPVQGRVSGSPHVEVEQRI